MSNLNTRAMLASISISLWSARRFDREVSKEVAEQRGAKMQRAGRYNKCLIDITTPTFVKVNQVAGAARTYHLATTLPWTQDGSAILSSALYGEYKAKMAMFEEEFWHAVKEFFDAYPQLVEDARTDPDFKGLFKQEDYPSIDELRRKYAFGIGIFPVPAAGDFRVGLDEDDVAAIRANIETELQNTLVSAERERWTRLMKVVSNAVAKLSSPDAIFRDSLIGNIEEAVETLPKMALSDDTAFDDIIKDVEKTLAGQDPKKLREDKVARSAIARKAKEIESRMSGIMAAFAS